MVSQLAEKEASRVIITEHLRRGWGVPQRGLIRDEFKLVHVLENDRWELFHIESDPGDSVNLIDSATPRLVDDLKGELAAYRERTTLRQGETASVSQETEGMLRELGYVE
jgi:hypothetical protein